jgi:hypothetical protein
VGRRLRACSGSSSSQRAESDRWAGETALRRGRSGWLRVEVWRRGTCPASLCRRSKPAIGTAPSVREHTGGNIGGLSQRGVLWWRVQTVSRWVGAVQEDEILPDYTAFGGV